MYVLLAIILKKLKGYVCFGQVNFEVKRRTLAGKNSTYRELQFFRVRLKQIFLYEIKKGQSRDLRINSTYLEIRLFRFLDNECRLYILF